LTPERLLTDFRVIGRDADEGILRVEVGALKRGDVDIHRQRLQALGFNVVAILLQDAAGDAASFKFSTGKRTLVRAGYHRNERLLVTAAALLGFSTLATAGIQSYRSQQVLAQVMQSTRSSASDALAHRQELLERLEPLTALNETERARSSSSLLLEATLLLPENSWLTTFERKEREIRIVGLSPDSAGIVRRLASSALMRDVTLRSSISAGIGTGLDRFEITAELQPVSP
jgi:hypothetical protein